MLSTTDLLGREKGGDADKKMIQALHALLIAVVKVFALPFWDK